MPLVRSLKRVHTFYRDPRATTEGAQGFYENGEWIEPEYVKMQGRMNVQPNFSSFLVKTLPEGDREKQAIWFSSDVWLYAADSGGMHKGDLIFYQGVFWEVRTSSPYGNFGTHCEGIAIKINKTPVLERVEGEVGVIRESDYPSP